MSSITRSVFRDALRSGLSADFRIRCQRYQFSVHKLVLCSASSWFATICSSTFKDNNENLVDLPDHDPATVAWVLMYLYTSDYSLRVKAEDSSLQKDSEDSNSVETAANPEAGNDSQYTQLPCDPSTDPMTKLKVHTIVYKAADFLDIPGLKKHALEKFSSDFSCEILTSPALHELVTLVYDSMPADDKFRNFFSDRIIFNHKTVADNRAALRGMLRFKPVAWTLGTHHYLQLSEAEEAKDAMQRQLIDSQDEVDVLLAQVGDLICDKTQAKKDLPVLINEERSKAGGLLNSDVIKFCPCCGKDLYLVVKRESSIWEWVPMRTTSKTKCLACSKSWLIESALVNV